MTKTNIKTIKTSEKHFKNSENKISKRTSGKLNASEIIKTWGICSKEVLKFVNGNMYIIIIC